MADENTIGVVATLDTSAFEAGAKRLDDKIKEINEGLDKEEKDFIRRAKEREQYEKKLQAEQEKASNATIAASRRAAAAHESANQNIVRTLGKLAIVTAAVSVAVVKGYEYLKDSAIRLGDDEAMAGFNAVDNALSNLKDTFDAVLLSAIPVEDALSGIADVIDRVAQVATLAGAGIVKVATLALGVGRFLQDFKLGIVPKDIGAEIENIIALAQKSGERVIAAGKSAPGRATSATNIAKASAEADKQRQKDTQAIFDYYAKIEDLQIKAGEDILAAQQDFNAKSSEAWQSYMEKVSDIVAEGVQKRAELARDYSEKIADAETDYQSSVESAAIAHGKQMADIERDYQRTIRDIQNTYQTDALEAIRNLDAIGLVRAREKRDKDLAAAAQSRDEAQSDESQNYSRQLYELQKSLEDKKKEAQLAYQRGLEDQRRAEQDAMQEAKSAYNKQVSDAAQAQADKLAAIQRGYNNENAAAQAQYGYAESAYRSHLAAMQALTAAYGIGAVTTSRGGAGTIHRRAEGGLDVVSSPTQFMAGDAGPELVYTAPLNRAIPYAMPQVVTHTGEFQHSIDSTIRSSVAGIDGRIVAAVSKVLREVLG